MASKNIDKIINTFESICSSRGIKFTQQRKDILKIIVSENKPISAYDILKKISNSSSIPAPQTVYRVLDFLLEQGFIHKLESQHTYVGCSSPKEEKHHGQFFICTSCGDATEVSNKDVTETIQLTNKSVGFKLEKPVVEILGKCHDCDSLSS